MMAAKSYLSRAAGYTLVEIIVGMVVLAGALTSLGIFLFPQIENSARSHYEVRATALAHSLMTEIMARGYDHNSDADGGMSRCGETGSTACSTTLGPDSGSSDYDTSGNLVPADFNDVDDYIGCWYTNSASRPFCESATQVGSLNDIFGKDISASYRNFVAIVAVEVVTIPIGQTTGASPVTQNADFKQVSVTVTAGSYGSYTFTAYRGNF